MFCAGNSRPLALACNIREAARESLSFLYLFFKRVYDYGSIFFFFLSDIDRTVKLDNSKKELSESIGVMLQT